MGDHAAGASVEAGKRSSGWQEAEELAPTVPNATEEEWQRRLEKRRRIIDLVKRGQDYADHAPDMGQAAPRTPDPTERTSKRQWEQAMAEWRKGCDSREY